MNLEQLLSSPLMEWLNSGDESETDSLLLAASDNYEGLTSSTHNAPPTDSTHPDPAPNTPGTSSTHQRPPTARATASRFAPPKSDTEIQRAREKAIPNSTKDTKYCINI